MPDAEHDRLPAVRRFAFNELVDFCGHRSLKFASVAEGTDSAGRTIDEVTAVGADTEVRNVLARIDERKEFNARRAFAHFRLRFRFDRSSRNAMTASRSPSRRSRTREITRRCANERACSATI